jgi:hypothetical protein
MASKRRVWWCGAVKKRSGMSFYAVVGLGLHPWLLRACGGAEAGRHYDGIAAGRERALHLDASICFSAATTAHRKHQHIEACSLHITSTRRPATSYSCCATLASRCCQAGPTPTSSTRRQR